MSGNPSFLLLSQDTQKQTLWSLNKHLERSPLLNATATVRPNDQEATLFRDVFLPHKSLIAPNYRDFFRKPLPLYLADLSASINKAFAIYRAIAYEAYRNPNRPLGEPDIQNVIRSVSSVYRQSFYDKQPNGKTNKAYRQAVDGFCGSVGGGSTTVIRKTTVPANCYRIEFCGFPPRDASANQTFNLVAATPSLPTIKKSQTGSVPVTAGLFGGSQTYLDQTTESNPNLALIKSCIAGATALLQSLFKSNFLNDQGAFDKDTLVQTAHRRVPSHFPVNFDFSLLLNNLSVKLGEQDIHLGVLFSHVLKPVTAALQKSAYHKTSTALENFVSISLYREPDPRLTLFYLKKLGELQEQDPTTALGKMARETDNSAYCDLFALRLQPAVTVSFSLILTENLAQFVSQSPQVDMFNLTAWVNTWTQAAVKRELPLDYDRLPLYFSPVTKIKTLKDLRKQLGFVTLEGRNSDDGLFINSEGNLQYAPKAGDDLGAESNAVKYTSIMSQLIGSLYQAGLPFSPLTIMPENNSPPVMGFDLYHNAALLPSDVHRAEPNSDSDLILRTKQQTSDVIHHLKGSVLGVSWDEGVVCKAMGDGLLDVNNTGLLSYHYIGTGSVPDPIDYAYLYGHPMGKYKTLDQDGQETEHQEEVTPWQSFQRLFPNTQVITSKGNQPAKSGGLPMVAKTTVFESFLNAYCFFVLMGDLPALPDLLISVANRIDPYKTSKSFSYKNTPYDWVLERPKDKKDISGKNMYHVLLNDDFSLKLEHVPSQPVPTGSPLISDPAALTYQGLKTLFDLTIQEACASPTDSQGVLAGLHGRGVSVSSYHINLKNKATTLADFQKVYRFFGGRVVLTALLAFLNLSKKRVMGVSKDEYTRAKDYRKKLVSTGVGVDVHRPSYDELSKHVYPFCVLLGKFMLSNDNSTSTVDGLLQKATQHQSKAQNPSGITESQLLIPDLEKDVGGRGKGFSLMPHQFKAMARLHGHANKAIIDYSAGSGKTAIYITEMATLIETYRRYAQANPEHNIKPLVPLVVCPDNLIKSVSNEAAAFLGKTWNVVPINSEIFSRHGWGIDKLNHLLLDPNNPPPPNTIYVAGYDFLSSHRFNVVIGNRVTPVYGGIEFLKRLQINYIVFDEAHYLKNSDSNRYHVCKMMATLPNMEFLRLATGTLFPNSIEDIQGQAGLLNTLLFQTPEKFTDEFYQKTPSGKSSHTLVEDAGDRVMGRLHNHFCYMKARRRDWANLYPDLILKVHHVPLAEVPEGTDPQQKDTVAMLADLHSKLYEAILGRAVDEFSQDLGLNTGQQTNKTFDEASSEGIESLDFGEQEQLGKVSQKLLKYWMQRLEQVIIDPFGDVTLFTDFVKTPEDLNTEKQAELNRLAKTLSSLTKASTAFKKEFYRAKKADLDHKYTVLQNISDTLQNLTKGSDLLYTSPKLRQMVGLVRDHFVTPEPWKAKTQYPVFAKVTYHNVRYTARRFFKGMFPESHPHHSTVETTASTFLSTLPPDQDTDRWYKEEASSRLIIVCSYTRTAKAAYQALQNLLCSQNPDVLRSDQVLLYIGSGEESEESLAVFANPKSDAKVLISNIRKIQVGHNLQLAGRTVTLETPWTPGEVDQTFSRTYRPDSAQSDPFKRRPAVYVDWMVADNSLEVPKLMRLTAKSILTAKLTEHGNPNYALLNNVSLEMVGMSLERLRGTDTVENATYQEYLRGLYLLHTIQQNDIDTAREKTGKQSPLQLPTDVPVPPTFKAMPFKPMVRDQAIKDVYGLGLIKLTDAFAKTATILEKFKAKPNLLTGMLVMTQYGSGKIVDTELNRESNGEINPFKPVKSVKVRLLNCFKFLNSAVVQLDVLSVYLVKNKEQAEKAGLTQAIKPIGTQRGSAVVVGGKTADQLRAELAAKYQQQILQSQHAIAQNVTTAVTGGIVDLRDSTVGAEIEPALPEVTLNPLLINNRYAVTADQAVDFLTQHGFRLYGGFLSADLATTVDLYAAFSYINNKVKQYNANNPKTPYRIFQPSIDELKLIFKTAHQGSTATSVGRILLPMVKTSAFAVNWNRYYTQQAMNPQTVYLFYMFTAFYDQGQPAYTLKLCVDAKPRAALKTALHLDINKHINHSYNVNSTGKTMIGHFLFRPEPKAALLLTDTVQPSAVVGALDQVIRGLNASCDTHRFANSSMAVLVERLHSHVKNFGDK